MPAVDDRRHGSILYLPIAISIHNIREIITSRLYIKFSNPLPTEIYIPSNEWIRLQFLPKNPFAHAATQYTGKFKVKYKVQTRILRKEHIDGHYCAAIFRYLRELAIK